MRPCHPQRSEDWVRIWKEVLFKYFIQAYGNKIVFFDEMRIGLLGQCRRAWGKKGLRLAQQRQLSYKWAYLALWLDPNTHEIHWTWIADMKARTLLELMKTWPERFRAVVWDRAPSHRAKALNELQVGRIPLPPYAPDLNPVERIFEEIRRHVEGKVYQNIEDKKEAVDAYLKSLNRGKIESLTNWKYIQTAMQVA